MKSVDIELHRKTFRAIKSLRPNAQFTLYQDSAIDWDDKIQSCPTQEEIAEEIARLDQIDESLEYQRLRSKEYPSFADQFDLLYHGGYDAWKASIDAVKSKYPKE